MCPVGNVIIECLGCGRTWGHLECLGWGQYWGSLRMFRVWSYLGSLAQKGCSYLTGAPSRICPTTIRCLSGVKIIHPDFLFFADERLIDFVSPK